ncbi:MFS transporter [Rathayibacter sp. SD072]|uniref:MFS transporter n=1 Tax=Rathayibacter sp. SD072 TaxID=2781731 RepID=UPI001A973660|nr:MFS transporter [Rathayibacter sp. SD072]MBO0982608.1 MFS transporter [Rathayibacter sp. SD072]
MTRQTTPAEGSTGRIIFVLALAGVTGAFMQTILVPIQAQLPSLLGATRDQTAWAITATLLVAAVCTPIAGRLGDMFGKRRIALTLIGFLVAGSIVSALSTSVVPLIVGRGLQGAGMGVIPLGIGILRDLVPRERLTSATALVSSTLGIGGALGLPVSAIVTQHLDWHFLFWGAAVLGAVTFALVLVVIPASTTPTGGRFDWIGAIGLSGGLVCLLLAISQGNTWGWGSPAIVSLFAGSVAVLGLWGWFEWRTSAPLVDLRSSARAPVLLTNIASIAMGFALFSNSIVFPQLLQLPTAAGGMGLDLVASSLMLIPAGIAMLITSPLAGRLGKRIGAKALLVLGALVVSSAYFLASILDLQAWHVLIINPMIGVGVGLGYAAMPTLIMSAVPITQTGAAIGLNTLMRSLGTSVASALIAGVLSSQVVRVGSARYPDTAGFDTALLLGLTAGVICAAIAVFIPKSRAPLGETSPGSAAASASDLAVAPAR